MLFFSLQVIQNFYNAMLKHFQTDSFASGETYEGLLVTLKTTMEVAEYLINELGYSYILTAKLNQDCLEVRIKHCEN